MTTSKRFTVPKKAIDWILSRVHVGTSEADVAANIRSRCEKSMTPVQTERCVAYALKAHATNLKLYQGVMTGRF